MGLLPRPAPASALSPRAADAAGAYAPLADFHLDTARAVIDTKLLGPWLVGSQGHPREE
jgi:hypothetical protein